MVAAKNLSMYVDILFWQSAHQKLPRSDYANQINCALVSSKIVCVGDAAQVGATRASLAGWSCHFHLLCCRYAFPFLLSGSALVPLIFCLLHLPFNLPFILHFSLPFSLPFELTLAACSTLSITATPSVWLVGVCFLSVVRVSDHHVHAKPSSAFAAAKQRDKPCSITSIVLAASFHTLAPPASTTASLGQPLAYFPMAS